MYFINLPAQLLPQGQRPIFNKFALTTLFYKFALKPLFFPLAGIPATAFFHFLKIIMKNIFKNNTLKICHKLNLLNAVKLCLKIILLNFIINQILLMLDIIYYN